MLPCTVIFITPFGVSCNLMSCQAKNASSEPYIVNCIILLHTFSKSYFTFLSEVTGMVYLCFLHGVLEGRSVCHVLCMLYSALPNKITFLCCTFCATKIRFLKYYK
jgi:hypothetical protein